MLLGILAFLTASVSAFSAWRWRTTWRECSRRDVILAAAAVPVLFSILALAASSVTRMPADLWSNIRLAPSVAMTRGYALYYPEGEGPILGWIYGPVMPLLLLPAALIPDPVAAILAAGIISEVVLLLPLLLVAWNVLPPTPSGRATGVLILGGLLPILLQIRPSLYWLQHLQVDAFALGLALLSMNALLGGDPARPLSPSRLWLAALFFAGAVFSKQNEVCLLPVLLAYVGIRDGWRQAIRMAAMVAATAGAGLLLLVISFGWRAVYLNLWQVPSRHPLSEGWQGIQVIASRYVGHLSKMTAGFVGLWLWSLRCFPRASTLRERILRAPWVMPAVGVVVMFPMSVVGGAKVGGDGNSNHSLYYLAAAIVLLAAQLATVDRPATRIGIPALALLAAAVAIPRLWSRARPPSLEWRHSPLETEYRFAQAHPGEVFFSSNPLVTLYSDGKLYHLGYGVFDRRLADMPPSPRQLEDHLPARMRWIFTPADPPFWIPRPVRLISPPHGMPSMGFWLEYQGKPH